MLLETHHRRCWEEKTRTKQGVNPGASLAEKSGKGREKKDIVRKRQRDPGEILALVFIPRH